MTARARTLSVFAAGALMAPLLALPASPAFAAGEATPPQPRSIADFCANVPADSEPFTDIEGNTFEANIECLAFTEITQGQSGGRTYGPGAFVKRDQMASFIARLIDKADELDTGENIKPLPAFDGVVTFTDVAPNSTHRENIDRLAEAGIVNGGPGGRPRTEYGPQLEVSRAQMASFIIRALEYMTGESYDTADDYFTDDQGSTHEPNINAVAALAIAVGSGPDTYAPNTSVNRGQMSAFLTRTLAFLESEDAIVPAGEGEGEEPAPEPGTDNIQVTPDTEVTLEAVANPDTVTTDDREYSVSGLVEGEEYRITVLEASTVEGDGQDAVFTDSDNDNLAEVGERTADITEVNGETPQNNTGDGTTTTDVEGGRSQTAVFTAGADGTATFTIDGDENGESVRPVVYRNGGEGNEDADGGQSPRLELNDDGTAADAADLGGVTVFEAEPAVGVTDAPELLSVAFVRTVDNDSNTTNDNSRSVFRFTFDEDVVGTNLDDVAADFHVIEFDGTRFDGDTAQRDPNDASSVLVIFNENGFNTSTTSPDENDDFRAADIADLTVGTVDAGAVADTDGDANPVGDAPLGSGVSFTAGQTEAPDLVSIGNFRSAPTTGTEPSAATLVDFTFDESAFVVDPATGQFQLIRNNGQELEGTPEENTATTAEGDFQGEGTRTITVEFENVDLDGVAGTEAITAADVARGVVLANTVSDTRQTGSPFDPLTGEGAEGTTNPLQVTDANDGGATTLPDLVSATVDEDEGTVTYVFDEDVVAATDGEAGFQVYDKDGNAFEGTGFSARDTDGDDSTVIVEFEGQELGAVVGASVDDDAVRETTGTTPRGNQEDEVGVDSPDVVAGSTLGPDLLEVTREVQTRTTTDPITGAVTTEDTGVTIRFVFDDEASIVTTRTGGQAGEFAVVSEDGTRTVLSGCEQEDPAVGDENTVACEVPADDGNPFTNNDAARFDAVRNSVLGTVDDESVEDDEGQVNPEGAEVISERNTA